MPSKLRLASLSLLTLALMWPAEVAAGEPRLDAIAGERGIAPGELTLGDRRSSSVASVASERRELRLHGLRVRGGFETVWRAGSVHETVVAARYPVAPPQRLPSQARLDLDDARMRVDSLRPGQARSEITGELVYLLVLDLPVLAWELTTPMSLAAPEPTRERIWISAVTGRELERESLMFSLNQAEVFRFNPRSTPEPITATIDNLDPELTWSDEQDPEQTWLNGSRVRVFNCLDEEDGPFAPWRDDDECYPTQTIAADANGDFFVPLPDVSISANNIDPTDPYAELSMYYHAEKFFEFMAVLGVTEFPCDVSNMVANFHWQEPAPGYPDNVYGPLNNAYYSGSCEITAGPTMLFGQGSAVDFGYDGDVVYHELGHGIVQQLTPEGLTSSTKRSDGLLRDARGLNEAIADYHTIMLTEDPQLAEYVGFYWAELDTGWIRNAENQLECPRDMAGQEHNDGEPFGAALWSARYRIGEKLDPVVLGALALLPADATLEVASAALLEVAAVEVEAGTWTALDYEELERTFVARNLVDCLRVTEATIEPEDGRFLYVRGKSDAVTPFWPGPLQLRHTIPAGSDNLLISFKVAGQGNSAGQPTNDDVDPRILVKVGAPIVFEYEVGNLGHAEGEDEEVDEVTLVSGDWTAEHLPSVLSEERREVFIRDLEPGDVVHVSFINRAATTAVVREVVVGSVPAEDLDGGSPTDTAADPDDLRLDDGCDCSSGRERNAGGLAVGFVLLALARRRRSAGR